jgi:hypothetical protein
MTPRLLAALVAATLLATPAVAHAQLRTSISIAGGLSAPVSTLADHADAGYNLAAGLAFGAPLIPAGIRLEVGLNGFNGQTGTVSNASDVRIISGTVNGTLAMGPLGSSPYLIGGVGAYNRRFSSDGLASGDRTTGGFNAGAGVRFPLGSLGTFVEARYHHMLGNASDGTNYRFIPVTFGVSF